MFNVIVAAAIEKQEKLAGVVHMVHTVKWLGGQHVVAADNFRKMELFAGNGLWSVHKISPCQKSDRARNQPVFARKLFGFYYMIGVEKRQEEKEERDEIYGTKPGSSGEPLHGYDKGALAGRLRIFCLREYFPTCQERRRCP